MTPPTPSWEERLKEYRMNLYGSKDGVPMETPEIYALPKSVLEAEIAQAEKRGREEAEDECECESRKREALNVTTGKKTIFRKANYKIADSK